MAKPKKSKSEFVLFDVYYEDGTRRSNRRVPSDLVDGLDGDKPVRAEIEEQDRKIVEQSGRPFAPITRIVRAGKG